MSESQLSMTLPHEASVIDIHKLGLPQAADLSRGYNLKKGYTQPSKRQAREITLPEIKEQRIRPIPIGPRDPNRDVFNGTRHYNKGPRSYLSQIINPGYFSKNTDFS